MKSQTLMNPKEEEKTNNNVVIKHITKKQPQIEQLDYNNKSNNKNKCKKARSITTR